MRVELLPQVVVETACTPEEALTLLGNRPFDVIVSDLRPLAS